MIKKLLFILFSLGSFCLSAGTGLKQVYPMNGSNFVINNNPNQVIHQAVLSGGINWAVYVNTTLEFYSLTNTLELNQHESADLPVNFEYDLTVKGKLEYYQIGSTAINTQIVELHINNKMHGSSKRIDFYAYSNAYNSKFTITSLVLTGTPPPGKDLFTEVGKIAELDFGIQQTHFIQPVFSTANFITNINACADITTISNDLVLSWASVVYAEEYELEIVYADDYKEDGTALLQSDISYDFRENATRVIIKSLFYKLPLIYDRGYILYRLRPVGRGGPLWDKRIPGPWSAGLAFGQLSGFTNKYHVAAHTGNKLNWQVTTTYADEGKRKDIVQYSDGLYMTRQTITGVTEDRNVFTENIKDNGMPLNAGCSVNGIDKLKEIIAQENIYDFNGRVGVQIMPAATGIHRMDYLPHLNQNLAGKPYSWKDFDTLTACSLPARGLNQSTAGAFGAGGYYSVNNPNKVGYNAFIPDAVGFPFSRVQYTDDNTGRIYRQGGVGAGFQLGSTHETKFFYGTPNQVELDRMFGTEAGYAKRYLKKMVVDPNGQTSVTYENASGKTIATALAGSRPDNLLPLDNEPQTPVKIDIDLMPDSIVDNFAHSMSINKQFTVPAAGPYEFNYTVKGEQLNYTTCNNLNICLDCIYDLSITLHSNDGCTVLPFFNYTGTFGDLLQSSKLPNIDKSCYRASGNGFMDKTNDFPAGFIRTLDQGSYTLEKKLTVNKNAADAYVNLVFADTCRAKFDSFLNDEMSRIDTTDCNQSCSSCKNSYPNDYAAQCASMCTEPLNECDQARKMMLADLKPGGQYAKFSVGSDGKYYSNDPLSIFSTSSSLPSNQALSAIVNLNSTGINDSLYINNRINNWNLSTAQENILLKSHPEYCMLQWCGTENTGKNYDLKLRSANTLAEALTAGIISNGSTPAATYIQMLNNDPFFPHPGTNYSAFLAFMNNVCNTNPNENMLQMAMHAAYCSSSPDMQNITNNILNNPGGPQSNVTATAPPCQLPANYLTTHIFGSDPNTKEMEWKMLRDFYLSYKEKYLYESRRDYSINNGCFNGCIGTQNFFFMFSPPGFTTSGFPYFVGGNNVHNGYSYSGEGYIPTNSSEPCGLSYALYQNKVKRFTNRYDAFSHTTSQTPINLTGIDLYNNCPSLTDAANIQSQITGITGKFLCDSFHVVQTKLPCPINDLIGMLNQNLPHDALAHTVILQGNQIPVVFRNYGSGQIVSKIKIEFSISQYLISFYTGDKLICESSIPIPQGERGFVSQICCPVAVTSGQGFTTFSITLTYSNGTKHTAGFGTKCPWFVNCGDAPSTGTGSSAAVLSAAEKPAVSITEKGRAAVPSGKQSPATVKTPVTADKQKEIARNPSVKADTCKTLSPFANELFSFLNELKKTKAEKEGQYSYNKGRSTLYSRFIGASMIRYTYNESKECSLRFTGRSTHELKDSTCTITFADCKWMGSGFSLISIKPYFDNSNAQTNKFILTYLDVKSNRTIQVIGVSSCLPINECKTSILCGNDSLLQLPHDPSNYNSCVEAKYLLARDNASQRYTHWVDSMRNDLEKKYYAKCMKAAETLRYNYYDDQFHYTLYYYDQAGNLTRTIPPAGIRLLSTADAADVDYKRIHNSGSKVPMHAFITNYKYNSLNQLTWQKNPDAGITIFLYDKLGRIAASQNSKQKPVKNYSYTYYDILGRTVESGELLLNGTLNQSTVDNYAGWEAYLHTLSQPRRDITFTKYDETFNTAINDKFGSAGQQNLRGRVASILSFENNNLQADGSYRHATHYTYDVSGNVPVIIQDYPLTHLGDKVIAYNFDLVSGKVNEVRYEPGMPDEFRHKYSYDDGLRLTNVYTSRKGIIWERDAEYFYYKHGPLARTEIGQLKVQGLDYIYTLQGWIKGVNGTDENVKQDAGRDGIALENAVLGTSVINGQSVSISVESNPNLNSTAPGYHSLHNTVAKDAFAYVLNYYNGDYSPIAGTENTTSAMNSSMAGVQPLYNGNISRMYTNLQTLGGLGMNYKYDQLNRLKNQDAFTFIGAVPTPLGAYGMDMSYDGNGNILSLNRYGRESNPKMDMLNYRYLDANNAEIPNMASPPANATNRLASIKDMVDPGAYPEAGSPVNGTVTDIDNQNSNNYTYDSIGNLTKDNAEGIQNINWNLQNKITEIDKTDSRLNYAYDALGNRVYKKYNFNDHITETFYVRDASGTVMGTYEYKENILTWKEQDLYGSSRLGIWKPELVMAESHVWPGTTDWQNIQPQAIIQDSLIRGSKQYELSNHLGNVLATISDRRLQTLPAPNGTSGITADLLSANDYYAFGAQMPGRSFVGAHGYRYGFNGKENDNEVKGNGNQQDYGMRIYDPRLGRWLSLDPLQKKYPELSPYHSFANNPILVVDRDGKENIVYVAISPKAYSTLGVIRAGLMMAEAQKSMDNIVGEGVVKVQFAPVGLGEFDIKNLDKTDAVVAIGSIAEVEGFANKNDNPISITEGDNVGNTSNPISGINMKGIVGGANFLKESVESTLAGIIVHEVGHDAVRGHPNKPDNNDWSVSAFKGGVYTDYVTNTENNPARAKDNPANKDLKSDYGKKFDLKKTPKDNYKPNENKRKDVPYKTK